MKNLKKQTVLPLVYTILLVGLFGTSCSKDKDVVEPVPVDPIVAGEDIYSVLAYVGTNEETYLAGSSDVTSGNISIVGNGIELLAYGVSAQRGDYYYFWNYQASTIEQYLASGTDYTLQASIALPPLLPDERPRAMNWTDDGNLIINSWPDSQGNVYYAIISNPGFQVVHNGHVTLSSIGAYAPESAELVVANGKAYMGTSYFEPSLRTYPDSLITWVFDYPSFTNGQMQVSDVTAGNVSGYVGNGNIVDENGDVYQSNISSKHWEYVGATPVISKLSNGTYDQSYQFDLSTHFPSAVGLWGIIYAGNGIAYAKVIEEGATSVWADLGYANITSLAKIDLYNKTVTRLNVPMFKGLYVQGAASHNGNLYFPVSIDGGNANVYSIQNNGGSNDFTQGALIDGNNVLSARVFVH